MPFTSGFINIHLNTKRRSRPCGTVMVVQLESEASKTEVLLRRISELERALGQKQMIIDYQEKLIEVASEELDIDLKKSFAHKP